MFGWFESRPMAVISRRHPSASAPSSTEAESTFTATSGKRFESGEGSMSKLFAGETAVWVTEQAIQILGGYGYTREASCSSLWGAGQAVGWACGRRVTPPVGVAGACELVLADR